MAAPLHLEMAEAHVAELLDFGGVQRQYALVFICQQSVEAAAAVGGLPGFELAVVEAHEAEGRLGKRVVVEGADGTVADAVLVDEQDVALLVLNLLQQVVVQHVVGVHHHLIVFIGQALVGIELAFAAAVGNLEDGGDNLERGVFLADVLAQDIAGQNDGVSACGVVAAEEDAERVAEGILQVCLIQQQVGEGEVDGDVALLVFQTGGAYFLGLAHQVLEHAAGVPLAQRGAVHDVESFESEQQLAVVVECNQLAVVHERA